MDNGQTDDMKHKIYIIVSYGSEKARIYRCPTLRYNQTPREREREKQEV